MKAHCALCTYRNSLVGLAMVSDSRMIVRSGVGRKIKEWVGSGPSRMTLFLRVGDYGTNLHRRLF